jgi:hypothetical protein
MTPEDSSSASATIGHREPDLRGLADTAKQRARALADEGKVNAAERIGSIASAIRGAAKELEPQMPQGADLIRGAAASLENGAERLRGRSVEEWLQSANKLAHDQPLAVFGGAILAGFVLSRFFNSSPPAPAGGQSQS